jgi:transcriptional repressor NrdR
MLCPKCKSDKLSVIDSRDTDEKSVRRRRECEDCGHRFTTYERVDPVKLSVLKRSGEIESFDKGKIIRGIAVAANGRISNEEIEEIVDDMEQKFAESGENVVPTRKIGNLVISKLKKKDEISYLRFASVYKNFQGIDSFEEELEKLKK